MFSKTSHIAKSSWLRSGLDRGHKNLQSFRKFLGLCFGVKQIIDILSFLFLLKYIGVNFNEKMLELKKI